MSESERCAEIKCEERERKKYTQMFTVQNPSDKMKMAIKKTHCAIIFFSFAFSLALSAIFVFAVFFFVFVTANVQQ